MHCLSYVYNISHHNLKKFWFYEIVSLNQSNIKFRNFIQIFNKFKTKIKLNLWNYWALEPIL